MSHQLPHLVAAALLITCGPGPARAQDNPSLEQCLLRELLQAAPEATVQSLRQRCNAAAAPTPDPAAPSPAARPAAEMLKPGSDADLSLFERRLGSELRASSEPFALLPHRPNYLQPISLYSRSASGDPAADSTPAWETQFQISFKFPLTRPLFGSRVVPFFSYTGQAWWQVYDAARSRPFREYNHEPELAVAMATTSLNLLGWQQRAVLLGFNHQSNGRSVPESRSWNRLTAEMLFDRGSSGWATVKLWHRLPERPKSSDTDSAGDDNPDITRFLGNFELRLGWVTAGHKLTLMGRRSLRSDGKGALQADWSYPLPGSPALRLHMRWFNGYGESLIDYNRRVERLGVGVMLNDWF
jgi:phospholipase A1/A2